MFMMPSNKNALMVGSAPTNKEAARAPDKKYLDHLLNHWSSQKKITEMFLKKLSINSTPLNKGVARALEEISLNA